eukprot:1138860-Pelagomonas_calceolata.AAC.2
MGHFQTRVVKRSCDSPKGSTHARPLRLLAPPPDEVEDEPVPPTHVAPCFLAASRAWVSPVSKAFLSLSASTILPLMYLQSNTEEGGPQDRGTRDTATTMGVKRRVEEGGPQDRGTRDTATTMGVERDTT